MTQYNILNVKLSNSKLKKLKPEKNGTEATLNLLSNVIGNSNVIPEKAISYSTKK